ncbi:MAG: Rieske (2Fe-2S) protein [Hyphomonadaceae bacterium]|nr:Rieske (2Fe-2S) protein [Hyphomonadaceae bacterium]
MDGATRPLACAGVYRRHVKASLARIWENVFDWEHLPSLHSRDFAACALLARGPWGWRVRLVNQPGDETKAQILELQVDRSARTYRVTTVDGPGAGSEIRVQLTPTGAHETDVCVEFLVAETAPERLEAIGRRYVAVYERLWDEDEAMMIARERALARSRRARGAVARSLRLGPEADVRRRLPMTVTHGGARYRIVEVDGELLVHAATCPHWLAPLDEAPVVDGVVRCPWHGYAFDVRSGACVSGQAVALGRAPLLSTIDGELFLVAAT